MRAVAAQQGCGQKKCELLKLGLNQAPPAVGIRSYVQIILDGLSNSSGLRASTLADDATHRDDKLLTEAPKT